MPTQSAAAEKISLYQPDQEDLIFPETPVFDQVADDREYRKKHLVAACRAFDYHGFDYGFAERTARAGGCAAVNFRARESRLAGAPSGRRVARRIARYG